MGREMTEAAQSIDLNLAERLNDQTYRRAFFRAEASAEIARQLISLRKRRNLTQAQLAELAGTGQPAISRCERADYQNWTIATLRSITDALDGRLRVVIEAVEDVLPEYETSAVTDDASASDDRQRLHALEGPSVRDAMRPEQPGIGPSARSKTGLVGQGTLRAMILAPSESAWSLSR